MKNERKFFRCDICGNMTYSLKDSGPAMSCCGQDMTLLTCNTTDAAQEKHVPVAQDEAGQIRVVVGSVPHPQIPEHHIEWIAVAEGANTQFHTLEPNGKTPCADFSVQGEVVTMYEYCNLHGLWASDADSASLLYTESCSAEFTEGCK